MGKVRVTRIVARLNIGGPAVHIINLTAGLDPDRALHVYRKDTLALRIRSLREGSKLAVEDTESGTPGLRLARPPRRGAASPMQKNGGGAS